MYDTYHSLYKVYIFLTFGSIALGLNFIFLTPAFMPLHLEKWLVGMAFLGCGITELLLLLWFGSNPKWASISMAIGVIIYLFWAVATTYDFFDRSLTSLQLPIYCAIVAGVGFFLLLVPFINPAAVKNGANGR